jgi:5-methylcytosine-specific restriction endonuclease McrA
MEQGRLKPFSEAMSDLLGTDRDKILEIFKYRCVNCESVRTHIVHEIVPRSHGKKSLEPKNRVPLCPTCHDWAHRNTTESTPYLIEKRKKVLEKLGYEDD